MPKRFRESLNYSAEALGMDDPRGEYMFGLEDRVSKLEREAKVFGSSPERRRLARRMTASINSNLER